MISTFTSPSPPPVNFPPTYGAMQRRIQGLVDRYLPLDHLTDRLTDLPQQFHHP